MFYQDVQQDLRAIADPEIADDSLRFFKTGVGEYGEGDQFLGIRVPDIREVARHYRQLSIKHTEKLLSSNYHEERLCALIILVNKVKKTDPEKHRKIYELYLDNTSHINNWDLIDTSAQHIVGSYLADKERTALYTLAKSDHWWDRRIAIMSTFHFIKEKDFDDTFGIAELLITDDHDLIHKAVGWMLREIGKRNRSTEEVFLEKHIQNMPRTMLRYAIEKFPENKRQYYLQR